MADDLDDEWWLQENNRPDTQESNSKDASTDDEHIQQKRKPNDEEHDDVPADEPPKKKRKKKKQNITEVLKKNPPQAGCPGDVVTAMAKHFKDKLSPVEDDEIQLSDEHFLQSNTLDQSPSSYLGTILPKWKKQIQKLDAPGAPLLLIISSTALRTLELKRLVQSFLGDETKTAKLFGKHMKAKEQEKYLAKTVLHCGMGTPSRIKSLLDSGGLKMSHLHYIVFDWNWRDQKQKRLIDAPEIKTTGNLMELLQKHLIPHVKAGSAKFGLL